jgi:hypothetical protein
MRREIRVGADRNARRAVPEVEARSLHRCRHDPQCRDPGVLEFFGDHPQQHNVPPTERSVESPKQREQDRAPAPVLRERNDAVLVGSGELEVRGWIARLQRSSRPDYGHGLVLDGVPALILQNPIPVNSRRWTARVRRL